MNKTLALDLEGTLISNAVSAFPRPGLYDFLSFCWVTFDHLVVFTSVPETTAKRIMGILSAEGSAPAWFADLDVFTCERLMQKDLDRIGQPGDVWLVDDQEAYVPPDQKGQWIPVREFMPPFTQADEELARVKDEIFDKLASSKPKRKRRPRPSEQLEIYREQIKAIAERYHVTNVRVFGSTARGEDTDKSDLDLLVTPIKGATGLMELVRIENEVKKLIKVPVDVVLDSEIPEQYREKINKEAIAL